MDNLKIAIVDDHPILLEGIASTFRKRSGFEIVALGSNAAEAVAIARDRRPDILCLDFGVPGDAVATIRTISQSFAPTKVVVFTASESPDHALAALNAGALGFVLKGSNADELVAAMRLAYQGEVYITPGFAAKAIHALQLKKAHPPPIAASRLSFREDQIVRMLLQGKKNREIAAALRLSEHTVKGYMTVLMQKFDARSRLEVVIAIQQHPEIMQGARADADSKVCHLA